MTNGAVLFAGGGTGGHLHPALAIEERLREVAPELTTRFICSDRPLDARLLSEGGASWTAIPARPFSLRPKGLARLVRTWGACVRRARGLIRELQDAHGGVVVVAMGGYVAAAPSQAARAEGAALALVNLDATPGKANRWIARRADARLAACDIEGGTPGGWEVVGPIARRRSLAGAPAGACRAALGLDPEKPTLFVTGGSQGAGSINAMMVEICGERRGVFEGWQVIHQSGERDLERVRGAYAEGGVRAVVEASFQEMGRCWGAADLAVSRAGAGSVAEVGLNQVATVFLPYPHHRDAHQSRNAAPLVVAGGAVIAEDLVDPARNARGGGGAGAEIERLMRSVDAREEMRGALAGLGWADGALGAARRIAGLARE